jgi:zinc protease
MRHFRFIFISIVFLWISITQANAIQFKKINASDTHPEIWYTSNQTVPTVSFQISFPMGYAFDPQDKLGLATLVAATMDEGAGVLNSDAFRKELVDNQISLHYEASQERFFLSLNFLKFDKDKSLELATLSLNNPRFDVESLELMRQQLIANIENIRKNPDDIASNLLRQTYYKNHVFSKPSQGTLNSLKHITRDDLVKFHQKLSLENAFVSVVGDISESEILDFTQNLVSKLPKKSDFDTVISDYTVQPESHKINVYSDVPQSSIIMTTPSIKRTDATFFPTYIATHILGGGGFGSELINNLREKKGLTYSAGAYLDSSLYDGRMLIQFSTDNKKLDDALSETEKTLKNLADTGITQTQLDKAKTNLKGQYIIAFETNHDIASLAQELYNQGLPYNYIQKRDALFDAVTVNDVNKVMKELLIQPLTMIVVGGNKDIKNFKTVSIDTIQF